LCPQPACFILENRKTFYLPTTSFYLFYLSLLTFSKKKAQTKYNKLSIRAFCYLFQVSEVPCINKKPELRKHYLLNPGFLVPQADFLPVSKVP
jgi:hypothetical protein